VIAGIVGLFLFLGARRRGATARQEQARALVASANALVESATNVPVLSDSGAMQLWTTLLETQNRTLVASLEALGAGSSEAEIAALTALTGARERLAQSIESYRTMERITPPVTQDQVAFSTASIRVHADELKAATQAVNVAFIPPPPPAPPTA
jgi:hypothetical protein